MEQFRRRCRGFFDTLWPAEEKTLVFGEGQSVHPPVMLIGEAPGEQETLQGRPFVGKAGRNLDGFLQAIALRREDIYITNVVKVRPTRVSARGSVSNRPPNREELLLFTPFLYEEIQLVRPKVIVLLGSTAARHTLGPDIRITRDRGRWFERKGVWMMPTYHPSALLRDPAKKREAWEDMQSLRDRLMELSLYEDLYGRGE